MEKFRHLILKMHSQSFPRQDVQNRCRGRCSWTFLFHFCGRMSRIVSLLWCFWTFLRHFRGVMSRIVTCGRVFGHFPVTSVSGGPDQAPCGCAFGHFSDTSAERGPLWLRPLLKTILLYQTENQVPKCIQKRMQKRIQKRIQKRPAGHDRYMHAGLSAEAYSRYVSLRGE